jgi:ribulose kinase
MVGFVKNGAGLHYYFLGLLVVFSYHVVPSFAATPIKIVVGVDGGTESIRACCFDASTGRVIGKSCAVSYPTFHPQPGWAEQDPEHWFENLGKAVRGAVDSVQVDNDHDFIFEICGLCVDTTCCSVVALDKDFNPLRRSLLWMDARSVSQTEEILRRCKGDPALKVNCGGEGPLSAEWMTPKALWIRQNEPDVWENAKTICEYQDYINFKLTGQMCASSCNAAARWHWDGEVS